MARGKKKTSPTDVAFTGDERVVILHGKDAFLIQEYTDRLAAALREKHTELDRISFSGGSAELADVLDELRSIGLMMQHKLIIVDDAEQFVTKYRDALERYCESPEEASTLLLRAGGRWFTGKLDKKAAKVGQVIKADEVSDPRVAAKFLRQRAKAEHQRELANDAAGLLIEKIGLNIGRLSGELSKLSIAGDPDGPITIAEVEALVGRSSEEDAWAIQEAMLSGDADRALTKLGELIDYSGQAEQLVMYFVADLCRKLCRASAMLREGTSANDIAKELRLWGQKKSAMLGAARNIDPATLARLLRTITDYDRRSKSGLGEPRMQLEKFCALFTTAVR